MDKPDNFYETFGLARGATDMDIAQAYRALVQKLRADPQPSAQQQLSKRLQQLEAAYQTLLDPEQRKRHDEKLAWYTARQRLDAEKARVEAQRQKDAQEARAEAEKAAAVAAARLLAEETVRQAEEAALREEHARVEAEAAETFRRLREARQQEAQEQGFAPTQAGEEHEPEPQQTPLAAPRYSIGVLTAIGSGLFVVVFFLLYLVLRPTSPTVVPAPAPASAPGATVTIVAPPAESLASAPAQAPAPAAVAPTAPAKPAAPPPKPVKQDAATLAETQQYQKVLHQAESEHPELNPQRAEYRAEAVAYVAARVAVHTKAGYARPKALEIAVRDLEMRDQARLMADRLQAEKAKAAEVPPVLDKGGHTGFDPKCRWVTPQEWSCK